MTNNLKAFIHIKKQNTKANTAEVEMVSAYVSLKVLDMSCYAWNIQSATRLFERKLATNVNCKNSWVSAEESRVRD